MSEDCSQVAAVEWTVGKHAAIDAVPDTLAGVLCLRGILGGIRAAAVRSLQRKQCCERNNERQQQPQVSAMRHADLSHGSAVNDRSAVNDSIVEGWQFDAEPDQTTRWDERDLATLLVSRFRSSHHCAAPSLANFGIEGH